MRIEYKADKHSEIRAIETNLDLAKLPEAAVYALAEDAAVVKIQARMRTHHKKLSEGKTDKLPTDWNAFVCPRERMSKVARLRSVMEELSEEEVKALMAELTAKAKGAKK